MQTHPHRHRVKAAPKMPRKTAAGAARLPRRVNAAKAATAAREAELRALESDSPGHDPSQDWLDAERLIDSVVWRDR